MKGIKIEGGTPHEVNLVEMSNSNVKIKLISLEIMILKGK